MRAREWGSGDLFKLHGNMAEERFRVTLHNSIWDDSAFDLRRSRVQNLAAAGNILLLARGLEIMKYTLENIFNLSYYGVNNNTNSKRAKHIIGASFNQFRNHNGAHFLETC